MKKSELKTGMWVEVEQILGEHKSISMAIVLLGTENGDIISGQTWCPLDSYDEDLEYLECHTRINKIYQPTNNIDYLRVEHTFSFKYRQDELIWERQ
jgi:hypothetical protein